MSCDLSEDLVPVDWADSEWRKARKQHACGECGDEIQITERYEYVRYSFEGTMSAYCRCSGCSALAYHLRAPYESLIESIFDSEILKALTSCGLDCDEEDTIPAAGRQKLIDLWNGDDSYAEYRHKYLSKDPDRWRHPCRKH